MQVYIVAEARLSALPGAVPKAKKGAKAGDKPEGGFTLLAKVKGKDLVGLRCGAPRYSTWDGLPARPTPLIRRRLFRSP